jgi:hypothetical protein
MNRTDRRCHRAQIRRNSAGGKLRSHGLQHYIHDHYRRYQNFRRMCDMKLFEMLTKVRLVDW